MWQKCHVCGLRMAIRWTRICLLYTSGERQFLRHHAVRSDGFVGAYSLSKGAGGAEKQCNSRAGRNPNPANHARLQVEGQGKGSLTSERTTGSIVQPDFAAPHTAHFARHFLLWAAANGFVTKKPHDKSVISEQNFTSLAKEQKSRGRNAMTIASTTLDLSLIHI